MRSAGQRALPWPAQPTALIHDQLPFDEHSAGDVAHQGAYSIAFNIAERYRCSFRAD